MQILLHLGGAWLGFQFVILVYAGRHPCRKFMERPLIMHSRAAVSSGLNESSDLFQENRVHETRNSLNVPISKKPPHIIKVDFRRVGDPRVGDFRRLRRFFALSGALWKEYTTA